MTNKAILQLAKNGVSVFIPYPADDAYGETYVFNNKEEFLKFMGTYVYETFEDPSTEVKHYEY